MNSFVLVNPTGKFKVMNKFIGGDKRSKALNACRENIVDYSYALKNLLVERYGNSCISDNSLWYITKREMDNKVYLYKGMRCYGYVSTVDDSDGYTRTNNKVDDTNKEISHLVRYLACCIDTLVTLLDAKYWSDFVFFNSTTLMSGRRVLYCCPQPIIKDMLFKKDNVHFFMGMVKVSPIPLFKEGDPDKIKADLKEIFYYSDAISDGVLDALNKLSSGSNWVVEENFDRVLYRGKSPNGEDLKVLFNF